MENKIPCQCRLRYEKVKKMKELSQGYNIVAQSQGNLVARGLIEFCDNAPPVLNYVSLGGPHAGISDIPNCSTKLYSKDWIGLETSDIAGKVKFVSVSGAHLQMAKDDVVKYVVPTFSSEFRLSRKAMETLQS